MSRQVLVWWRQSVLFSVFSSPFCFLSSPSPVTFPLTYHVLSSPSFDLSPDLVSSESWRYTCPCHFFSLCLSVVNSALSSCTSSSDLVNSWMTFKLHCPALLSDCSVLSFTAAVSRSVCYVLSRVACMLLQWVLCVYRRRHAGGSDGCHIFSDWGKPETDLLLSGQ